MISLCKIGGWVINCKIHINKLKKLNGTVSWNSRHRTFSNQTNYFPSDFINSTLYVFIKREYYSTSFVLRALFIIIYFSITCANKMLACVSVSVFVYRIYKQFMVLLIAENHIFTICYNKILPVSLVYLYGKAENQSLKLSTMFNAFIR